MEEIDISQLFNYFKSKIIYILFAMSIAFCLSSIYVNRFRVPEYTSSTTILLNQASENTAISSTDINLNKSLVTTYSEIIKSKRVLRQVIQILALDMEYSELYGKVAVGEITDTSIIRISVTDEDNELAADIANTIADVFAKEIVDIYNIENISIIDTAEVSEVASSMSALKIIGVVTIIGAFLSIGVIFVVFYFDTTIKSEEDIEKLTGLPVIGIVPSSREKIKYSQHRKYYDELAKKHKTHEILPVQRELKKIEVTEEKVTGNEIVVSMKEKEEIPVLKQAKEEKVEKVEEKVLEKETIQEEKKEEKVVEEKVVKSENKKIVPTGIKEDLKDLIEELHEEEELEKNKSKVTSSMKADKTAIKQANDKNVKTTEATKKAGSYKKKSGKK